MVQVTQTIEIKMLKYILPMVMLTRCELGHSATVDLDVTPPRLQINISMPKAPIRLLGRQPSVQESHISYEDIMPIAKQTRPVHPPVDVTGDSPLKRTVSFTTQRQVPYVPGVRIIASYGYAFMKPESLLGYRVKDTPIGSITTYCSHTPLAVDVIKHSNVK